MNKLTDERKWLVILPKPNCQRDVIGRHHTRNEAEHHAQKLNRLLGGFQLLVTEVEIDQATENALENSLQAA